MIFILRMGHSEQIHRLLVRVGGAHWYQVLVCLLCSIIALESGSTSLVNVFLFYQSPYVCSSSIQNCT